MPVTIVCAVNVKVFIPSDGLPSCACTQLAFLNLQRVRQQPIAVFAFEVDVTFHCTVVYAFWFVHFDADPWLVVFCVQPDKTDDTRTDTCYNAWFANIGYCKSEAITLDVAFCNKARFLHLSFPFLLSLFV